MTLKHPTVAETIWKHRNETGKPLSRVLRTVPVQYDVERGQDRYGPYIQYTFDDDTSILTRGRGATQYVQVNLP